MSCIRAPIEFSGRWTTGWDQLVGRGLGGRGVVGAGVYVTV